VGVEVYDRINRGAHRGKEVWKLGYGSDYMRL